MIENFDDSDQCNGAGNRVELESLDQPYSATKHTFPFIFIQYIYAKHSLVFVCVSSEAGF